MATETTECVKPRRLGIIRVTHRLLEEVLYLPEGARILRVLDPPIRSLHQGCAEILVEHSSFREVDEGDQVPDYRVLHRRTEIETEFELL